MSDLETFARNCGAWSDDYLLEELGRGADAYGDPKYHEIIRAEVERRNLLSRDALTALSASLTTAEPERSVLRRLWEGEISLPVTYWVFGFLGNAVLNATYVGASLIAPELGALLLFPLLGYWYLMAVAIWRSAGNYEGPAVWAMLARGVVLLGVLLMVLRILSALA